MLTVLAFNLVADGLRDSLGRERPGGEQSGGGERESRRYGFGRFTRAVRGGRVPAVTQRRRCSTSRTYGWSSSAAGAGCRSWRRPVSACSGGDARPGRRERFGQDRLRARGHGPLAGQGVAGDRLHPLRGAGAHHAQPRRLRKLRGNEMAMIFQEPMTSLNPAYTVGNQIAEQVRAHKDISRADAWKIAIEMLDRVEIPQAAAGPRTIRTPSRAGCVSGS